MRTFKTSKEDFMKQKYITCPKCSYNNEKARFLQFGKCLKCGAILDQKTYFMIEINKRLRNNERKRG